MYKQIKEAGIEIAGIYLLWITLHYGASHLYVSFCTPPTWSGFLMSPFLVTTPHCRALQWTIHHGTSTIETMWFFLGTWIGRYLLLPKAVV